MVDALLGAYRDFSEHLRGALALYGLQEAALPPFDDVPDGLAQLGVPLAVLTNSSAQGARATLAEAGLADRFEAIIGVDAVRTFKPHPATYAHALEVLRRRPGEVLFVSAHGWDVAGARHAGMHTAFIRRGRPHPPALPRADVEVDSLGSLGRGLFEVFAGRSAA